MRHRDGETSLRNHNLKSQPNPLRPGVCGLIRKRLGNNKGASMVVALVYMTICLIFAGILITSASTARGRLYSISEFRAGTHQVMTVAKVIREEVKNDADNQLLKSYIEQCGSAKYSEFTSSVDDKQTINGVFVPTYINDSVLKKADFYLYIPGDSSKGEYDSYGVQVSFKITQNGNSYSIGDTKILNWNPAELDTVKGGN